MEKYYVAETENINCHLTSKHYDVIEAKSLSSAKRLASKKQYFQGTTLQLFSDNKIRIAYKEHKQKWVND